MDISSINTNVSVTTFWETNNSIFLAKYIRRFVVSSLMVRLYYIVCIFLAILSAILYSLNTNEKKSDQSSVYIILTYVWDYSTIFLPYQSIKYLSLIFTQENIVLLVQEQSKYSSQYVKRFKILTIINMIFSFGATIVYAAVLGPLYGSLVFLVCIVPITTCSTMTIFLLDLMYYQCDSFISTLSLNGSWHYSEYSDTSNLLGDENDSIHTVRDKYLSVVQSYRHMSQCYGWLIGQLYIYILIMLIICIWVSNIYTYVVIPITGTTVLLFLLYIQLLHHTARTNEIGFILSDVISTNILTNASQSTSRPSTSYKPCNQVLLESNIPNSTNDLLHRSTVSTSLLESEIEVTGINRHERDIERNRYDIHDANQLLLCLNHMKAEFKIGPGIYIRYRLALTVVSALILGLLPKIIYRELY